ncbi:hypothetical protein QQ045_013375 [Rhodiola kirilowii]
MAFTLRAVKVPPNSALLEEARVRTFDFFRTARKSMSRIMDIYNLHDVATISHLRSTVASQIRKNATVTNPKVRLLLFSIYRFSISVAMDSTLCCNLPIYLLNYVFVAVFDLVSIVIESIRN